MNYKLYLNYNLVHCYTTNSFVSENVNFNVYFILVLQIYFPIKKKKNKNKILINIIFHLYIIYTVIFYDVAILI